MTPINFHKKEKPLTSLVSMGGGAAGMQFGGGAAEKTYIDDVFSTYVYTGTAASGRAVTNNIDMNGNGAMLWVKRRDSTNNNIIVDSVRGPTKYLYSNSSTAETDGSSRIQSFSSTGFVCGDSSATNGGPGDKYVSWTFGKKKGFFDIVTYTGDGSTSQLISHSLGCVPGLIMVKCTSNSGAEWMVYHRDTDIADPGNYRLLLDQNVARVADTGAWNNTEPTATHFTVGDGSNTNGSSRTYVAYLYAGGPSSAAGAHSISFPAASGQVRRILCGNASNTTADFNFGTGDLTIECWMQCNASQGTYPRVVAIGPQWSAEMAAIQWDHDETANRVSFYCYNHSSSTTAPLLQSSVKGFNGDGLWHHVAVTRNGNTWRLFVDGIIEDLETWTGSPTSADSYCTIGNTPGTATTAWFGGYISNVRIVKGTAVYTDSFRVPYEPLKNITNTKLLCCNNLSGTAATVTPIALTETNIIQNQTYNPFDDSAGFKFGEEGDQNIVKCGRYIGNGSSTGPEVYVGWEPQWVMVKRVDSTDNWPVWDVIRGLTTDGTDNQLRMDQDAAEHTTGVTIAVTSTGFKLETSGSEVNANNGDYIYMVIRRPDGYVGKLPSAATGSFAMDTGNSSSTIPVYDSGFPVDWTLQRKPAATFDWDAVSRITGKYMQANTTAADNTYNLYTFDSNVGWAKDSGCDSSFMSWMWKRGAGFDIVCWNGNGAVRRIKHNLGQAPEFMIVKRRSAVEDWTCYHNGLNGGTNPSWYYIQLNGNYPEGQYTDYEPGNPGAYNMWNREDPTSTQITIGRHDRVNTSGQTYMALLFASANDADDNPISKVGRYAGQADDLTITTGFAPRFLMVKRTSGNEGWVTLDTLRGWGAGNDEVLFINGNGAQSGGLNVGAPTATGFTVSGGNNWVNTTGADWIYYAHA